jgi:hypothetical protein
LSTGLPRDARLSELTDAQRVQSCRGLYDALSGALASQAMMIQCDIEAVGATVAVSLS